MDNSEAMSLLENIDNSVSFFYYLAKNDIDVSVIKGNVPFFIEKGSFSYDYDAFNYFYNDTAYDIANASWIGPNKINVLSNKYFAMHTEDCLLKKYFEKLGFSDFDNLDFLHNVIAKNIDFQANVNSVLEDNFDNSVSFVQYLFESTRKANGNIDQAESQETINEVDFFDGKSRLFNGYVLRCKDINGELCYLNNDDLRYFNQSSYKGNSTFEDNKSYVWLDNTMMYSLDNNYFEGIDNNLLKDFESFIRNQFGVNTFTDKSFFKDVVLRNKDIIYPKLNDADSIKDFINYLKINESRIFDDSLSFNEIKDIPLLCCDESVITNKTTVLVQYDEDAFLLSQKEWANGVFVVISPIYDSFSQNTLHFLKIERFDVNKIICSIIENSNFKKHICQTDYNIDFWRWINSIQLKIDSFDGLKKLCLYSNYNKFIVCNCLYISDVYQENGIESIVTKYDPNAQFVSSLYYGSDDTSMKSYWKPLFKKLGLRFDNKDILFDSVLPKLSLLEDDSVVAMLTKHISDLKAVWDDKKSLIKNLRVKTKSGDFKILSQTIIISMPTNDVVEPFEYNPLAELVSLNEELTTTKQLAHRKK